MTVPFIPFPARTAAADGPGAFAAFRPAAAGSETRPATTGQGSAAQPPAATQPAPCARPEVTLVRDGDHVTGIRVACSCGQVIDLECEAADSPPA